ncbi:MAG: glycosyltransferase family 4 protein [Acidobacteriia bacterium]|nr:glycosyltransferase family 4 protein [Terriglobia bacterium]
MRIGIDAHCVGQRKTGNETYTYNLVKHLGLLEPDDIDYIVYLTSKAEDNGWFFSGAQSRTKLIRPETPYLRIPIGLAVESRAEKLDVFHAQYLLPHHLRCRTVLTVHDVIYERFPEFFTKWDYYRNKIGVPRSCRRADHIITVSESSKRDLIEIYGLDARRITVTYPGPDDCYRPLHQEEAKERIRRRYGVEGEFILYVGAIQPRKNVPRLLSAFAELKHNQQIPQKLVIVGPKAWLAAEAFRAIQNHPAKGDIVVTGYVPQEDLAYFYNAATVFVYVSICEGFGLPVLEAMACGTPTITSRGSSLEEVAGGAAVLVDPLDVSAIAFAIENVLSDSNLRARLRVLGVARSSHFSCHEMALRTQAVYRQLMS